MIYWIKEKIRSFIDIIVSFFLTLREYGKIINVDSKSHLETLMLVTTHSLEKGMGIRDTKKGYGQKKATNLINYLTDYCKKGYNCNSFPFIESFKMLETYIDFQKNEKVDISNISSQFNQLKETFHIKNVSKAVECGFSFYDSDDLLQSRLFDFESFVSLRHSIRDYKKEIVPRNIIMKAVQIANRAPSACNRQPIKVYATNNYESAHKVDDLITGTGGFKDSIHNFAIITCNRSYFAGREIYQWYINGGIYLSFFVLALHSLGIGSIIMQWFAFYKTEAELKRLMGITNNEAIIAIIGLGYYPDKVKCIKAQRKEVDQMLHFF